MTRIPRLWQGYGLLLGLAFGFALLSGQGCPTAPPSGSDLNTTEANTSGQTTPSGQSSAEPSAAAAPITLPTAQVLFPNGSEQIQLGSIVSVSVFARHPSIPDPTIRIFYDRDTDATNGNTTIATVRASAGGVGWNTNGLALGNYYIGVEMVGITPAVIDYSDAAFGIVQGGQAGGGGGGGSGGTTTPVIQLTVTAPRNLNTLFQGQTFNIRWSTNLLPGQGTADVFREPDFDEDGVPDGQALRDVIGSPGIDAALQQLTFDTAEVLGNFFIGITVTSVDGQIVTAYSTGTVKILPRLLWVGDLATKRDKNKQVIPQTGVWRGAVMRGFDFYDNLGSAMIPADDYDGDGVSDIVFAAQFAKPHFFQSDGRGAGEAYLIYGNKTRLSGDYDVNNTGQNTGQNTLPGLIMPGVLPNPHGNQDVAGNKFAYTPDGLPTTGYSTDGLRSLTMLPDQDGDDKREIVFGFPWCDSYSLENQVADGLNPAPFDGEGRFENDGHFLRGGLIVLSSQNPLMTSRTSYSRHYDRVLNLQEVGQLFNHWTYTTVRDTCPQIGVVTYPCDGFWQQTTGGGFGSIDPPRLADPMPARLNVIPNDDAFGCSPFGRLIDINQVDSPPIPSSRGFFYGRLSGGDTTDLDYCVQSFPFDELGRMPIIGTGYPVEFIDLTTTTPSCSTRVLGASHQPYGCRILGQTSTQLNTSPPTTANRFGASITTSNGFLVIGAPLRTALKRDVRMLPTSDRFESGEVYILQMRRPGTPTLEYPWRLGDVAFSNTIPEPHNFIIDDVGYTRYNGACDTIQGGVGSVWWEMNHPIRVVGAAPGDRIGESVSGLMDVNFDGVDDLAIGGPGTNSGRGAIYILYRRQSEIENDYLLERLQLSPSDPNRHNGLMIIGEQGENLGMSIAAPGPANLKDDYNNDSFPDAIIGSPNATTANGFESGKVFILLGGKNLLNGQGGVTIPELMASGDGVLLVGAGQGDRAGETVTSAGDVNKDGIPDFLIAAPKATVPDIKFRKPGTDVYQSMRVSFQYKIDTNGDGVPDTNKNGIGIDRNGDGKADVLDPNGKLDADGKVIYTAADDLTGCGVTYLVFGDPLLKGTIGLNEIGTAALPGMIFVGHAAGNELGGGHTQNNLLSRGVSSAGDLDGDGYADLMISSVLADPDGKTNAGEVYVIYGFAP